LLIHAFELECASLSIFSCWRPPFTFFNTFFGSQDNVSCLAAGPGGDGVFASGSWDKTVRVWRNNECTQVLRGHELAVWAVLILDNGDIVSAAADKTIKVRRPYMLQVNTAID
jgi:WD40 repeat protein